MLTARSPAECLRQPSVCCILQIPRQHPENAADLEDWFEDAFGDKICSNLMEGQPINKVEKCPVITEETIKYVFEILELEC